MQLSQEVTEFLRAAAPLRDETLRIGPLTPEQCILQTQTLRTIPICAELGLVVLDDANDSNPFCLVTRGPIAGMVLHFSHDPGPRLSFSCLDSFLASLRSIHRQRVDIDKLPQGPLTPSEDQGALVEYLRCLLSRDDDRAATLLDIHFALLDPNQVTLIQEAAQHEDFFVREAVARFVLAHPDASFRDLAAELTKDRYPQVADPARRALAAIRQALRSRYTP